VSGEYVSDELFHFVGRHKEDDDARYALLKHIVGTGLLTGCFDSDGKATKRGPFNELTPFHSHDKTLPENHPWLSEDLTKIDAVCLCDIPEGSLGGHMNRYSHFGLSFDKSFVISKGGNPVNYVCFDSLDWVDVFANTEAGATSPCETLETRFKELYVQFMNLKRIITGKEPKKIDFKHFDRNDLGQVWLLFRSRFEDYVLNYLKPFRNPTEQNAWNNFYMEREWRVPGYFEFASDDIKQIVLPNNEYVSKFTNEMPEFSGRVRPDAPSAG
jgi:hypothetical protein